MGFEPVSKVSIRDKSTKIIVESKSSTSGNKNLFPKKSINETDKTRKRTILKPSASYSAGYSKKSSTNVLLRTSRIQKNFNRSSAGNQKSSKNILKRKSSSAIRQNNKHKNIGVVEKYTGDKKICKRNCRGAFAPTPLLTEFLRSIMLKNYEKAYRYCKLILHFEPNNETAKEFYLLIPKILDQISDDDDSNDEEHDDSSSTSSESSSSSDNQNSNESSVDYNSASEETWDEEDSSSSDSSPERKTPMKAITSGREVSNENLPSSSKILNSRKIIRKFFTEANPKVIEKLRAKVVPPHI